jgi:hypothetical protein
VLAEQKLNALVSIYEMVLRKGAAHVPFSRVHYATGMLVK